MTASSRAARMLDKVIGEPLISFLMIGGLLFWLYSSVTGDGKPVISVAQDVIDTLVAERELVLERPLTDTEISLIRENFVDQEVLVREAMARHLYLNDGQVRHRLADKMYFLLADDVGDPTPEELDEYYERNSDDYRVPELVSLSQRFFADRDSAARALLSDLEVGDSGIPFYMGSDLEGYGPLELAAIFGVSFTKELGDLDAGRWHGPVESVRGWHLVRVTHRESSKILPKDEIENRLILDWRGSQLAESRRHKLDMLRMNYHVVSTEGIAGEAAP